MGWGGVGWGGDTGALSTALVCITLAVFALVYINIGHHSHSILSLQEASHYQPQKLAIAAWSYCSGTDGGMLEGGRAVIARDDTAGGSWVHLARNEFPKQNEVGGGRVVYFPYHGVPVGGTTHLLEVEVHKAEVECLLELEYLLKDGLINSLLLELVQVTTGFILSASFLADLSSLFRRYNAKIVVDEVMTAGRTSEFLLYSVGSRQITSPWASGSWVAWCCVGTRQLALGMGQSPVWLGRVLCSMARWEAHLARFHRRLLAWPRICDRSCA